MNKLSENLKETSSDTNIANQVKVAKVLLLEELGKKIASLTEMTGKTLISTIEIFSNIIISCYFFQSKASSFNYFKNGKANVKKECL